MNETTTKAPEVPADRMNCRGCTAFEVVAGGWACLNLCAWREPVPLMPPCFEYSAEMHKAMDVHLALVEKLGPDHEETIGAMMSAMAIAPPHFREAMHAEVDRLGLIPEPSGYTADGTPMFALKDVAERLGVTEAELLAEARRLGVGQQLGDGDIHRIH